jgi:DNA-binding FadR family transcriptional regulator
VRERAEVTKLPKVVPRRLAEEVSSRILQQIVGGELPPGSQLPPENELAEEYGVSRVVIREALRVLNAKGVVEGRQGRNTTVRPIDSWNQLDPEILITLIKARKESRLAQEIIQMRRMLEVEAAGLAAANATDKDIAALREILSEMLDTTSDVPDYLSLENQFHARVWRAAGNRLLWSMVSSLREAFGSAKGLVTAHDHPGRDADHMALLEAIERRDATAAREAMEQDVLHFQEELRIVLANGLRETVAVRSTRPTVIVAARRTAQLPGAICHWGFGWYTYVAPGEPYADLAEAVRQTRERGFDTLRICSMPSYVTRAIDSGRDELEIANLGKGVVDNLRWYNFRGGVKIEPVKRLLWLFREAKRQGMRVIVSNWDFNQSFKFETQPALYETLRGMTTIAEEFSHIERTMRIVLTLLAENGLLDVVSVVEVHNELEGMEVGPSARLFDEMAGAEAGPRGTGLGSVRHIRSRSKGPIERTIAALRARFPQLLYTVNTVWPWSDPPPPGNQDVLSANFYVTDAPVLADYLALFEDGDVWQGAIMDDKVRPLLGAGAPSFDEWLQPLGDRWRDPYYPQAYLALWADPRRLLDFFTGAFAQAEPLIKRQVITWLNQLQQLSQSTGKAWYLGEGYADLASVTSLWDRSEQCLRFHAWVVEQALQRGACGLTPDTVAAPENPDVWALVDWMKGLNGHIVRGGTGR